MIYVLSTLLYRYVKNCKVSMKHEHMYDNSKYIKIHEIMCVTFVDRQLECLSNLAATPTET